MLSLDTVPDGVLTNKLMSQEHVSKITKEEKMRPCKMLIHRWDGINLYFKGKLIKWDFREGRGSSRSV